MVPEEAAGVFERLLREAVVEVAVLRGELQAHMERLEAARVTNEFLDGSLATKLGRVCEAMLQLVPELDERDRRLVQAAVRYFVLEEDGESDVESVCGLDDDVQVCNAVAGHLGRDDLIIELES